MYSINLLHVLAAVDYNMQSKCIYSQPAAIVIIATSMHASIHIAMKPLYIYVTLMLLQ